MSLASYVSVVFCPINFSSVCYAKSSNVEINMTQRFKPMGSYAIIDR